MKLFQQINEAKRIIHQEKGDVFSAKVYRDTENNEYQVHFFKQGKHMGEGPVSYHDDKEDAIGTAKASLKHMHSNMKEETTLKSFSKFIAEAKAIHPYALHVSDAGQGKYKVHAVGSELADGIKVGEHLTDTHLDDAAEMGAKIKHIKEKK